MGTGAFPGLFVVKITLPNTHVGGPALPGPSVTLPLPTELSVTLAEVLSCVVTTPHHPQLPSIQQPH